MPLTWWSMVIRDDWYFAGIHSSRLRWFNFPASCSSALFILSTLVHQRLLAFALLCICIPKCTCRGLPESFEFVLWALCRMSRQWSISIAGPYLWCSHRRNIPYSCTVSVQIEGLLLIEVQSYTCPQAFPILPWHSRWCTGCTWPKDNPSWPAPYPAFSCVDKMIWIDSKNR